MGSLVLRHTCDHNCVITIANSNCEIATVVQHSLWYWFYSSHDVTPITYYTHKHITHIITFILCHHPHTIVLRFSASVSDTSGSSTIQVIQKD